MKTQMLKDLSHSKIGQNMKQGMRQNQLPKRARFQQETKLPKLLMMAQNTKTKRLRFQAHKTRYGSSKEV